MSPVLNRSWWILQISDVSKLTNPCELYTLKTHIKVISLRPQFWHPFHSRIPLYWFPSHLILVGWRPRPTPRSLHLRFGQPHNTHTHTAHFAALCAAQVFYLSARGRRRRSRTHSRRCHDTDTPNFAAATALFRHVQQNHPGRGRRVVIVVARTLSRPAKPPVVDGGKFGRRYRFPQTTTGADVRTGRDRSGRTRWKVKSTRRGTYWTLTLYAYLLVDTQNPQESRHRGLDGAHIHTLAAYMPTYTSELIFGQGRSLVSALVTRFRGLL